MLKRFKFLLLAVVTTLIFGLAPQLAKAVDCSSSTAAAIQCGTNNVAGVPPNATPGNLDTTISHIVNLISLVVGIAAVIMIIVGGLRYIMSGGNQERIKSAKNTVLYALIGLIIVALAQVIVKFVFNQAT